MRLSAIMLDIVEYKVIRIRLYTFVAAINLIIVALASVTKVTIDFGSFISPILILPILAVLLASQLKIERGVAALDTVIALSLLITPSVIATYIALSLNMPLADGRLIGWDEALGLDWRKFIGYIDAHPIIASALGQAYISFSLILMLTPFILAVRGNGARAAILVVSFALLCLGASFVAIWFPSVGAFVSHGVGRDGVTNINPFFGFQFIEQFNAVREQATFVLRADAAEGIVTFPSVHAGAAVLCLWGAWADRLLRYPAVVLNGAMAISAITHGGHYFCDVIAGFALAIVALGIARIGMVEMVRTDTAGHRSAASDLVSA